MTSSSRLFELNLARYQQQNIFVRKYSNRQCTKAMRLIDLEAKNDLIDLLFDAFSDHHTQDEQARLAAGQDLDNYFNGITHQALLNCSWGYWKNDILIGACLLSYWQDRQCPFLDCIAIRNAWKSRNVIPFIFQASISSLIEAEQTKMCATISENNSLPIHLARRVGFVVIS